MSTGWCDRCGGVFFRWAAHDCKPYSVWCPEWDTDPENGATVHAASAQTAAERFAERADRNDHRIAASYESPVVHVRDADGTVTRWTVSGETFAHYSSVAAPEAP